jgi:putative DNA primase/helicase
MPPGLIPDRAVAERFLSILAPGTQKFTFQTFTDSRQKRDEYKASGMRDPLAGILHGALDDVWETLVKLSAAGAGIYVTINETDFQGRSAQNIIKVRAHFVDLDGAPMENLVRLESKPHLCIQTSPDRYHAYYLVHEAPLAQFPTTQKRLSKLMNGDPTVCDLPRVMRLPGFPNFKYPTGPFMVRLYGLNSLPPYSHANFQAALAAAEAKHSQPSDTSPLAETLAAGISSRPDMSQGYPDGQRTCELTRRAGWCLGPGGRMTEIEAAEACLAWNQHNKPPLSDEKVCETVASIARSEARKREATDDATLHFHTDLGNTQHFIKRHGENIKYVPEWQKWLVWNEGFWKVDDDGAVMRLIKETIGALYPAALKISDEQQRTALLKHAMRSQGEARIAAIEKMAQTEAPVVLSVQRLDANPWLIGVQNGVVDLKSGHFRPGRRDDYITKRSSATFDPGAQCPTWGAFLNTVTGGDADPQAYLQRMVGYAMTGSVSEEVLFVLHGVGNNGKSTFREIVHASLGEYAIAADASLLIERKAPGGATPEIARLKGRRLVAINETAQNDMLNETRVKYITSQDMISARHLHREFFDFYPTHKTVLTTNHKPVVHGTDVGIWRRLHLIPFVVALDKVAKVEKDFRERRLLPELNGILNWAIQGAMIYCRDGLNPPAIVRSATEEYRGDMDVVGQWLEERCELDPHATVPSSTVYGDYQRWAEGEVGWVLKQLKFRRNLTARGIEAAKGTHGQRLIQGLKLKYPLTCALAEI